jgi:hypothetical protein
MMKKNLFWLVRFRTISVDTRIYSKLIWFLQFTKTRLNHVEWLQARQTTFKAIPSSRMLNKTQKPLWMMQEILQWLFQDRHHRKLRIWISIKLIQKRRSWLTPNSYLWCLCNKKSLKNITKEAVNQFLLSFWSKIPAKQVYLQLQAWGNCMKKTLIFMLDLRSWKVWFVNRYKSHLNMKTRTWI